MYSQGGQRRFAPPAPGPVFSRDGNLETCGPMYGQDTCDAGVERLSLPIPTHDCNTMYLWQCVHADLESRRLPEIQPKTLEIPVAT
jgi:hypothetical protein